MSKCLHSDGVLGLRDVGPFKVYRKGGAIYLSHKGAERFRRVQINRKAADALVATLHADFAGSACRLLDDAKRAGSVGYYEMRRR